MELKELPYEVIQILNQFHAPERLKRHLEIVHHIANDLITFLEQQFPGLSYSKSLVLFGAATHDIGKAEVASELYKPGKTHERIGEHILINLGYSKEESRFARTHGNWEVENLKIEDILVCLCDKIWKGKRVPELETKIRDYIIHQLELPYWDVYFELDAFIEEVIVKSDSYLFYQDDASGV